MHHIKRRTPITTAYLVDVVVLHVHLLPGARLEVGLGEIGQLRHPLDPVLAALAQRVRGLNKGGGQQRGKRGSDESE